ncbi:MAG: phenylalanine--tRNA ligase subunit beta [Chloroflexota bacterium]|nr:MAG: phenylalanine--tRNA ligase subunit beta [Chloroflexota bacterium]
MGSRTSASSTGTICGSCGSSRERGNPVMRVSLKWLREYIDVAVPASDLAERLTLAGVAVERLHTTAENLNGVVVGKISALARHPNADRLQLATVDLGAESVTVVTGAPNIEIGNHVPYASVGTELWDTHQAPPRRSVLKPSKIRGIESLGMVCSAAELGLGDDHSGILILPYDTPVGAALADVLGDTILELELTPNRSDCLSMLGVAREIGALYGGAVRVPVERAHETGAPAAERVHVSIADSDLCRRYTATVIDDVRIGPSPAWMRERLEAAGVRPINNVVDITNYVMIEFGQPLHAFDLATIEAGEIIVRPARDGETLRTLDGVDRVLDSNVLVIADATRPVALAGVMGGEATEVSGRTTTILLESANFDPRSIRRTARRFQLPSEASRRFERGIPTVMAETAARRAAWLMQTIAGGRVAPGIADCYPTPDLARTIVVPLSEFRRLLGIDIGVDEAADVLGRLGCEVSALDSSVRVAPPEHRLDIAIPADVVEEVARVIGFDRLPATLPSGSPPPIEEDARRIGEECIRDAFARNGAMEIVSYSMTSDGARDRVPSGPTGDPLADAISARLMPDVEPIRLVNPLSAEMAILRTELVSQMLAAIRDNARWTDRDIVLFEMGRLYLGRADDLPEERRVACVGMGAFRSGDSWADRVAVDFRDIKGLLEGVFATLGITDIQFTAVTLPLFRRGHAAAILRGDQRDPQRVILGTVGRVSAEARRANALDESAYLALLDIEHLIDLTGRTRPIVPLKRFPAIRQDLSIELDAAVAAEDVRRAIVRAGRPLIGDARLFDVYVGDRVATGRRGLTYRITYTADDRTLTDADVAATHRKVEDAMRGQFGASVRGRDTT